MYFLEYFDRSFCIAHDDALGQFELNEAWRNSMLFHAVRKLLHKILLPELNRRNIHGYRNGCPSFLPECSLTCRFLYKPAADGNDQSTLLGNGDEFTRHDQS